MKWKTGVALKAIGLVVAMNVIVFAIQSIYQWVGLKPGIDYRAVKVGPEGFYVKQLAIILVAFTYYWDTVKRGKEN